MTQTEPKEGYKYEWKPNDFEIGRPKDWPYDNSQVGKLKNQSMKKFLLRLTAVPALFLALVLLIPTCIFTTRNSIDIWAMIYADTVTEY